MLLGCCIDLSRYDTLVSSGYDTITLAAKDVAAWSEEEFEENLKKLKGGPLKTVSLNSFCTPDLKLSGKGYSPEALKEYMEKLCARAAAFGIRYIGIGAPGSRSVPEGEDREKADRDFRDAMGVLCRAAEPFGIDVLLESVCSVECNYLTTTREALAMVKELGLPNLHLVYDIYHEYMENQPPEVIREAGDEIRVVHIAENTPDNRRAYLSPERLEFYRQYWLLLKEIGYEGEWNLECFLGDPEVEIPRSMEIMKKF